jgi:hypothetical protein
MAAGPVGLFAGDLRLEGESRRIERLPLCADKAGQRAAKVITELRVLEIESIGRQGGFDYQPTARVSTLRAEAALIRR